MTKIADDPVRHGADPPQEDTNTSLQTELAELKKAFAEFTERQRPETERIRTELAAACEERDRHKAELGRLQRQSAVAALARRSGFADPEYLDFLLGKHQIDPNDASSAGDFLAGYKSAHPRAFEVPIAPGGGSRPGTGFPVGGNSADEVELLLENAPELF